MSVSVLYIGYPSPGDDLHLSDELQAIRRALAQASEGASFHLHERMDVALEALPQLLLDLRPRVLHLSSHGTELGPVMKVAGQHRHVAPAQLGEILEGAPPELSLVVLRSCFSQGAAEAVATRDRVVIGSTSTIPTVRGADFSGALYAMLGSAAPPAAALAQALAATLHGDSALRGTVRLFPDDASPPPLVLAGGPAPREAPALRRSRDGMAPRQIVIHLDAYVESPSIDEVARELDALDPWHESRKVLRLSEFTNERLSHQERRPIPWEALNDAVRDLLIAADEQRPSDGRPHDYVLSGHAPHALFAQVGFHLGTWGGARQVVLHRNPDKTWLRGVLGSTEAHGRRYFDEREGLDLHDPAMGKGWVGLYLGSKPGTWKPQALAHMEAEELNPIGLIGLEHTFVSPDRPGQPSDLDDAGALSAAQDLAEVAARIWKLYPGCQGVVVFCNGPDLFGFLAARALNPRILGERRLRQAWFGPGGYSAAAELPLPPRRPPPLAQDPEALLRRDGVFRALARGMRSLKAEGGIVAEDLALPRAFGRAQPELPRLVHAAVRVLDPGEGPLGETFEVSSKRRILTLGHGLCAALEGLPDRELERVGALLLLHELIHEPLGIGGTNHSGVGRAGVVLEDADFWADALAVLAMTRWKIRVQGDEGARHAGEILRETVRSHLHGVAAFDRMEQGPRLRRLPERRLRRYLIWTLQRARAALVHDPDGVESLLSERLLVELAPLDGWVDERGDKIVRDPMGDTELFVGLSGWFKRQPRMAGNFEPSALVERARVMDTAAIEAAMAHVVDQNEAALSAWSAAGPEAASRPRGRSKPRSGARG